MFEMGDLVKVYGKHGIVVGEGKNNCSIWSDEWERSKTGTEKIRNEKIVKIDTTNDQDMKKKQEAFKEKYMKKRYEELRAKQEQ